jgi:histone H3/H4
MADADDALPLEEVGQVREQDKYLPIANISRIMKEALPQNAKVSKDAKELVQNFVSDFIIYITSQCAPASPHQPASPSS